MSYPMRTGGLLVAAGLLGGLITFLVTLAHDANGQSNSRLVQDLATKDAIREKLLRYSLLHDGDGADRNGRLWADALWTDNATFQVIYPDGLRKLGNGDIGLQGRETIYQAFGVQSPAPPGMAVRHAILDPAFDSITETTASTRTVELVIRGLPMVSASSNADLQNTVAYVMHDTWNKSADGEWRKSRSLVYCTVSCPELLPPVVKPR